MGARSGNNHLMTLPSAAGFDSGIRPMLDRYLAGSDIDARDRVALFRLAWDATCSAFAGRQSLSERFFFGDPVKMAGALTGNTNLKPLTERVDTFLKRAD
jgi:4-hydroxyphenylacetate 3-monooxygenase